MSVCLCVCVYSVQGGGLVHPHRAAAGSPDERRSAEAPPSFKQVCQKKKNCLKHLSA